jgi:hypothetical protein
VFYLIKVFDAFYLQLLKAFLVMHLIRQDKLLEAREGIEPPYEALQAPA